MQYHEEGTRPRIRTLAMSPRVLYLFTLFLSFLMKTEEIKKGKNCTDLYVIIIIIFALQTSSVRIKSLN